MSYTIAVNDQGSTDIVTVGSLTHDDNIVTVAEHSYLLDIRSQVVEL